MKRLVVLGSINMDIVAQVKQHPRHGETVVSKDLQFIPGGKGANQAVAARRLGSNVSFIGKVGEDLFGKQLSDFLKTENLKLENLSKSTESPTGTALVIVDKDSENIIIVSPGSNQKLSPEDTGNVVVSSDDIALATLEITEQAIEPLFKKVREEGGVTILNAAPGIKNNLFSLADYLIVNETELAFFAKAETIPKTNDDIVSAMRKIRSSNKQVVITTLGKKGVLALENNSVIELSAHRVKAVDATAAGDCFVGAFATALSENKNLKAALEFANAASAISVQKLGASVSLPRRSEVDSFLK